MLAAGVVRCVVCHILGTMLNVSFTANLLQLAPNLYWPIAEKKEKSGKKYTEEKRKKCNNYKNKTEPKSNEK